MEQWLSLHGLLSSYTYIYLIKLLYITLHDTQQPIKLGGYVYFNSYRHGMVKAHEKLL